MRLLGARAVLWARWCAVQLLLQARLKALAREMGAVTARVGRVTRPSNKAALVCKIRDLE